MGLEAAMRIPMGAGVPLLAPIDHAKPNKKKRSRQTVFGRDKFDCLRQGTSKRDGESQRTNSNDGAFFFF